jgi:hypothetical protein
VYEMLQLAWATRIAVEPSLKLSSSSIGRSSTNFSSSSRSRTWLLRGGELTLAAPCTPSSSQGSVGLSSAMPHMTGRQSTAMAILEDLATSGRFVPEIPTACGRALLRSHLAGGSRESKAESESVVHH